MLQASSAHQLLEAAAALAWPLILVVVLWKLFPLIETIVRSRSFAVKIGGMEVSVQDATEQIRTQIEDLQRQVILLRSNQPDQAGAAPDEAGALAGRAAGRGILWVDDKPSNNAIEIAQLRQQGVDVKQARSTEEAMALLDAKDLFAGVISDMGRFEGGGFQAHAGLSLLRAMREAGLDLPFIVYTSRRSADRAAENVKAAGGDGATASPVVLLEWVQKRLQPRS